MNPWQKQRNKNGWAGGIVEWTKGNVAHLSVVFSWDLPEAYQRAVWHKAMGRFVRAGGPAVALNPDYLAGVAITLDAGSISALPYHNPNATLTSRGCIRKCSFCAVPVTEGDLVELDDWEPRPIVCDNNLLACSVAHFDRVMDRLKPVKGVDCNQGLDARLLTKHHAERLAELDLKRVRLAWDHVKTEAQFMRAFELLRNAGIRASLIGIYVLIGYNDTPEDALYRLETIKGLGAWTNPMRYQPIDALVKNAHVADGWTHSELQRYVRYWSNLRRLWNVPFNEFRG